MISKFFAGKRTTVSLTHLNIICSMMHNYTGRDVSNALSSINLGIRQDLMESSFFVPVEIDGQCSPATARLLNGPSNTDLNTTQAKHTTSRAMRT